MPEDALRDTRSEDHLPVPITAVHQSRAAAAAIVALSALALLLLARQTQLEPAR